MNYFEFKKILDADPHSQDAAFQDACRNDARARAAHRQAMHMERILQHAVNIPVPGRYKDAIVFKQCNKRLQKQRRRVVWALAASVLFSVALSSFIWWQNRPSAVEDFVSRALMMDPVVYMNEEEIPMQEVKRVFAEVGSEVSDQIGRIRFMKMCATPNGQGIRMVMLNEENQPFTILYMPNTELDENLELNLRDHSGRVIALAKGSAAIIGRPHQEMAQLQSNLRTSIKPISDP